MRNRHRLNFRYRIHRQK